MFKQFLQFYTIAVYHGYCRSIKNQNFSINVVFLIHNISGSDRITCKVLLLVFYDHRPRVPSSSCQDFVLNKIKIKNMSFFKKNLKKYKTKKNTIYRSILKVAVRSNL